jgi:capsular polysaccharide biosynthesis protein
MSMDNSPQMKPQDTVIYLLGELKGETQAMRGQLSASSQAQALVNAENKAEHEEFRKTLEVHGSAITTIQATQPLRVSPWQKAGIVVAIPASLVALVGFITIYLQPN